MIRKESALWLVWRMIYPLLIIVAVEYFVELVATHVYFKPETATEELRKYSNYLVTIRSALVIPIYIFFIKKDVSIDKQNGKYVEYRRFNKAWLLLLIPAGIGASIGYNGLLTLSGIEKYSESYTQVKRFTYSSGIAFEIFSAVIIAPIAEELLFRGLIYKRIRNYLSSIWSIFISATIFGLIHGNLVQFVYAFLIGILLAYVFEKFKTVWASIIFHMSANLIAIILTEFLLNKIRLTIGFVMLISVISLAITFVTLKVLDVKFNRQEISVD